jgi:hypothetical protein
VTAIDDWFDDVELDLAAALDDPRARRDLVELAMVEVLLPRMPTASPNVKHRRRTAAIAGSIVAVAMVIALLLLPRREHPGATIVVDPRSRVVTAGDRTTLSDGGIHVVTAAEAEHVVDTPIGPVHVAPGSQAVLRANLSPPALYVEVTAGTATIGNEILHADQRGAYGDRITRRRLGPRIVVVIDTVDSRHLEATIPSGARRTFVMSRTVKLEAPATQGNTVELILSPDENEVFFVEPPP